MTTILIILMMSGIAAADDQTYGIIGECPNCADMEYGTASLSYERFDISTSEIEILETSEIPANGIEKNWAFGRRNFIPNNISGVMYDFEEGGNCLLPFRNKYPDVASFTTVLGTHPYGCDEPSYVSVGGNTCGNTRCYMRIYPYPNTYSNGTPMNWIYIINGRNAFSPITGPDYMGGYWPGTRARIQFKEDTKYISFLASTGGDLKVRLYDGKGKRYNPIHYDTIPITIYRDGTRPSNFTRFTVYLPDKDIIRMDLYGGFNAWHIDDLIIGGAPGYVPEGRRDYGYAAERMKTLIGAPYNEFAIGFNTLTQEFLTVDEITATDGQGQIYYNPLTGELETYPGIYDQNAIVWAFNVENGVTDHIVNHYDITKLAAYDFTEHVEYWDIKPGDVFFIDCAETPPDGTYGPDGLYDEVGIYIGPMIDDTGDMVDIIRITPDGVHYSTSEFINSNYGRNGLVDYRSLPDNPKGSKCPYPKLKGKPI